MASNIDTAIYTKFNELLERHGINPCSVTAELESENESVLYINDWPDEHLERLEKIAGDIGMTTMSKDQEFALRGNASEIYDALMAGLEKAPRARIAHPRN